MPWPRKTWIQLSSLNSSSSSRKMRPLERHRSILRWSVAGNSIVPAIVARSRRHRSVRPIVENDEVADPLPFEVGLAVEFVDVRLIELAVGKQTDEADRCRLDEMHAGRFERLEKSRRQAERDAVPVPDLAPLAAREAKPVRVRELLTVEVRQQQLLGCIIVDVLAANRRGRCRCDAAAECATANRVRERSSAYSGTKGSVRAQGTAIARSQGSQWLQSS